MKQKTELQIRANTLRDIGDMITLQELPDKWTLGLDISAGLYLLGMDEYAERESDDFASMSADELRELFRKVLFHGLV